MGQAKDVAQQYITALESEDLGAVKRLHASNAAFVAPGAEVVGPDQIAAYFKVFFDALSDTRHDVKNIIESGDTAVIEMVGNGTHTGPLVTPQGAVPPTGRRATLPILVILEVRAGKIARAHMEFDQVRFLTELGLMPQPTGASA
jgi:predicted ester cyclase